MYYFGGGNTNCMESKILAWPLSIAQLKRPEGIFYTFFPSLINKTFSNYKNLIQPTYVLTKI